jgi:hypothetical protein
VRRVRTNLVLRQLVCCVGGKLKWLCGWFCRAGSRWREKFNQIKETRRTTAPPARPETVPHYRCMTFAATKLTEEFSLQANVVERHEFSQVLSDVMALGVNIGSM